eukprot:TRINITY_DN52253_c0_g1_i1.p2 TRINITY_DN52253_c0_g1~~TRINITY_DN52253_c0_g1_i1.p2  ORF type:complete len:278 (+),score=34.72 TRINITY_DN52253_c0_g1_i1:290-1123(+)
MTQAAGSARRIGGGSCGDVLAAECAFKKAAPVQQRWNSRLVLTDEYHVLQDLHRQGAECVVPVLAVCWVGREVAWMAMPRMNIDLHKAGMLFDRALVKCARGLLRGLQHLDRCQVVHLDIKPSNIMLTAEGDPVLIDFGIARTAGQSAPIAYTPAWRPLECVVSDSVTAATSMDWHTGGLVIWQAACGHHPCGAEDADLGVMLGIMSHCVDDDPGGVARELLGEHRKRVFRPELGSAAPVSRRRAPRLHARQLPASRPGAGPPGPCRIPPRPADTAG